MEMNSLRIQNKERKLLVLLNVDSEKYEDYEKHLNSLPDCLLHLLVESLEIALSDNGGILYAQSIQRQLKDKQSEYSTQVLHLKNRLDQVVARNSELDQQVKSEQEKTEKAKMELSNYDYVSESLKSEVKSLKITNDNLSEQVVSLSKSKDELILENRTIQDALLVQQSESYLLKSKCSELSGKLSLLKSEQSFSENLIYELQSNERALKFQISQFEQEVSLVSTQNQWLTSQLQSKTDEYTNYRNEKNTAIQKLQIEIETLKTSLTVSDEGAKNLQDRLSDLQNINSTLHYKVQDMQTQAMTTEENLKHEIGLHKRAIESLKKSDTEKSEKLKGLVKELEDLEMSLNEKIKEMEGHVQSKEQQLINLQQRLHSLETELDDTTEKLKTADELLTRYGIEADESKKQYEPLSKTASLLTQLQKTGKTFTEVYTDFVNSQNQVAKLKLENDQLKVSLKDIVEEVEYKSKDFDEIIVSYDEMIRKNADLAKKVESLVSENKNLLNDYDDVQRRNADLMDDNHWLEQSNSDVCRQLRIALLQIEELQGNIPMGEPISEEMMMSDEVDAQGVISQRLVVFKNIQELQKKNFELVAIVRKLSESKEEVDYQERKLNYEDLKKRFEETKNECDLLREKIRKNEVLISSLTNEREMYKRISDETPQRKMRASSPFSRNGTPTPFSVYPQLDYSSSSIIADSSKAELEQARMQLSELQANFDTFRKEVFKDAKDFQVQLQSAQKESSEFKIKSAQLETQNQFLNERIGLLNNTLDHQTRELGELRSRQGSLLSNISQYEAKMKEADTEKSRILEELETVKRNLSQAKAEKDLFKSAENRFTEDRQMYIQERNRLHDLIKNLQVMHDELDRNELQTKKKLQVEKQQLEADLSDLKLKLAKTTAELTALVNRKESELFILKDKFDEQTREVQKNREEVIVYKTRVDGYDSKISLLEKSIRDKEDDIRQLRMRCSLSQAQASNSAGSGASASSYASGVDGVLDVDVQKLRDELKQVGLDAERYKKHAETYLDISKSAEEKLEQNNLAYNAFKASMEDRISSLENENSELVRKLEDANCQINHLTSSFGEEKKGLEKQREELICEIQKVSAELLSLKQTSEQSMNNQQELINDIKRHKEIADEAVSNYENEVVKHAKDIEQINLLKSKLSDVEAIKKSLELSVAQSTSALEDSEKSWNNQKELILKQVEDAQFKAQELLSQNELLHSQIESMGEQINRLRRPIVYDDGTVESGDIRSSLPEAERVAEELREVIRFLRREKEVLSYEKAVAVEECKRAEQRLTRISHDLQEARTKLVVEEQERQKGHFLTDNDYNDLKSKSSQVDLILESNHTLREENNRNRTRAESLDKQLAALQKEIGPLKQEVMNLRAEIQVRDQENQGLRKDCEKWQLRVQEIMSKYDQIDPMEHKELVKKCQELEVKTKVKIEELEATVASKIQTISQLEDSQAISQRKIQSWKKVTEQKQNEIAVLAEKLKGDNFSPEMKAELETLRAQVTEYQKKIDELQKECEKNKSKWTSVSKQALAWKARAEAVQGDEQSKQEIEALKTKYEGELDELKKKHQNDIESHRNEVEMKFKLRSSLADRKIANLEKQVNDLIQKIQDYENAQSEVNATDIAPEVTIPVSAPQPPMDVSAIEEVQEEFADMEDQQSVEQEDETPAEEEQQHHPEIEVDFKKRTREELPDEQNAKKARTTIVAEDDTGSVESVADDEKDDDYAPSEDEVEEEEEDEDEEYEEKKTLGTEIHTGPTSPTTAHDEPGESSAEENFEDVQQEYDFEDLVPAEEVSSQAGDESPLQSSRHSEQQSTTQTAKISTGEEGKTSTSTEVSPRPSVIPTAPIIVTSKGKHIKKITFDEEGTTTASTSKAASTSKPTAVPIGARRGGGRGGIVTAVRGMLSQGIGGRGAPRGRGGTGLSATTRARGRKNK